MSFHMYKRFISQTLKNHHHHLNPPHVSCSLFLAFYSSSSIENPTKNTSPVFDLLRKHNFSSKIALKVASELSYLKDAEKCDVVISFFKENGFSVDQLEKLVNSKPRLLISKVDRTIKPNIKIFQDFGFSSTDIADVIHAGPWILFRSTVNGVEPSVKVLRELLGSSSEVAKLLKISGLFLRYNLERTLLPNIELLKSCGISRDRIVRQLYSFPRFCLNKPEKMKTFIQKVDKLGCNRNTKLYLHAIRTMASMSDKNWRLKVEVFQKLGFSEEEIVSMFQRKPHVFAVSSRKIKKSVEVILDTGKYDLSCVFDHPEVLVCSVEKRLKPRFNVIGILESRNLIKKRPSFSTTFKYPDLKFFQKYVSPYSDQVSELTLEGEWTNVIYNFGDKKLEKQDENVL